MRLIGFMMGAVPCLLLLRLFILKPAQNEKLKLRISFSLIADWIPGATLAVFQRTKRGAVAGCSDWDFTLKV